jgi:hypothetical protein
MKKTILITVISGIIYSTFAQNEFIDNFNDGVVNNLQYQPFNALLTENFNGMEITPISNQEIGGVIIKPDLPKQGFSFNNPNARNSYELIIRPEFTDDHETALIEIQGEGGFIIESYLISNVDKKIYYINRDKYGNLDTSIFGGFSIGTDIIIQRAREYSWWPPVCTGPRCDYGIDIPGGVIFARWRIGSVARTQETPPTAESTINPTNIVVKTKSKIFVSKFTIRDFIPQLTHPLLALRTNNKFYRQNSGNEISLIINEPFFNLLSNFNISINGIQANNIQVISATEIRFTPPQNLDKGEKNINFLAYSSLENTQYEIQIDENLTYHSCINPLFIKDFDISKSLLELDQTYLIKLDSEGGEQKNHHFTLISGSLPKGMQLTPSGNIVGKTEETGVYGFFIKASDNSGEEYIKLFFIEVEIGKSKKLLDNSSTIKTNLSFYPNPVNNILNLEFPELKQQEKTIFKIFKISGEVVYFNSSFENFIQIDFSSFQNGQYVIEVVQGDKFFTERIDVIR